MKRYLISVKNNHKATQDNVFGYMTNEQFKAFDNQDPSKYIGTIPGGMAIH